MRFDLKNLPKDIDILHQLVQDMADVIKDHDTQIAHFKAMIKQLQRARFGRRSEQLNEDQLQLALQDFDAEELVEPISDIQQNDKIHKKPIGRKAFPDELPRDETILDIANHICPDCAEPLHKIGETASEMLDWIPAKLRVKRTCRPKYACRICAKIHQMPAPDRLAGMATPALLAQTLVSKYCDHTPLYRQSQILKRHNVHISRSTLAGW